MKKLVLILVFLMSLIAIFVIRNGAKDTQKETYISQVIIDAPWGKEPGQFGIYEPGEHGEEGPPVGPNTFTISPNSDIYILDLHGRVQKFDQDGRLLSAIPLSLVGIEICIDQSGHIYIYNTARVPKRIIQYDDKGTLLKEYSILWDDQGMRVVGGAHIYCDNTGRIFLSYRSDSLKTSVIFQVGTTEINFSPEQQRATLREGFVGSNNVVLNQGRILQTKEGELHLVELNPAKGVADSSSSVKKFSLYRLNLYPSGTASFTGVDEQMNIYTCKADLKTYSSIMRKYSPEGELVAEFNIQKDNYAHAKRSLILDEHGNIYVMSTSEDGLKIIKWSPVEGGN
jgi:hypothetical protein